MGVDKASMEVGGTPLISRVIAASSHVGPVQILGGPSSLVSLVQGTGDATAQVTHVPDSTDDPGPFGAIVSALGAVETPLALILSCDLAQLTREHVDRLCSAQRATRPDVAIPVVGERRQCHAMVVSMHILEVLQGRHGSGVRSVWRGFSGCSESLVVSSDPLFFVDVDTPEDIAALGSG